MYNRSGHAISIGRFSDPFFCWLSRQIEFKCLVRDDSIKKETRRKHKRLKCFWREETQMTFSQNPLNKK